MDDLDNFLRKWNNVSDSIYDSTTKPEKRVNLMRKSSNSMARVFRDYARFGLRAGVVLGDDPEVVEISARIEVSKAAFKEECVDELRHLEQQMTPNFRNIDGQ